MSLTLTDTCLFSVFVCHLIAQWLTVFPAAGPLQGHCHARVWPLQVDNKLLSCGSGIDALLSTNCAGFWNPALHSSNPQSDRVVQLGSGYITGHPAVVVR